MSKKTIKIVSVVLTIAIALMLSTTTLFAYSPANVDTNKEVNGIDNVTNAGESIIGTIRTVGVLIAVGILMVLGIKYMMGSAEEKASYKKTMMPYLVGAVLLFGASMIAEAVYNFAIGL